MSSPEVELAAVQEPTDQMVATPEPPAAPQTPKKAPIDSTGETRKPSTPMTKVTFKEPTATPRLRKKIPWKGKNILVLLPRDEERGEPGQAPLPLTSEEQGKMYQSWQELGYSVRGFDLEPAKGTYQEVEGYSQSRPGWPTAEDVTSERSNRNYTVTLPDLNAWRDYVNELNEAKLRALGVSFGDDEPPQPSISPALSQPSRQASVQYPPLPFSPPLPTSSSSSNPAAQQLPGFPFPAQFMPNGRSSATTTPGIASPAPFMGHANKFNPRQSISIPMGHSPFQPGHRASPSLAAWPMSAGPGRIGSPSMFNGVMSPLSPFSPDGLSHVPSPGGFNSHQRHQSLQYPMLPHQHFMQQAAPARASPRLQELREDDEEEEGEVSPPRSPEPVQHNDDDLQAEIDEAEYHLEEQMRNELEHEDYSPHNEEKKPEDVPILKDDTPYSSLAHSREPSVQFQAPLLVAKQTGDGPVLHHPRPHSRGHSLTKSYFQEDAHAAADVDVWADAAAQKADEAAEIETNPSNLGTPVQDFSISSLLQQHARTLSTTSNPWHEAQSVATNNARQRGPPSHGSRPSHGSKPSLSGLNVNAPEFKFNPGNDFKPGNQFGFSAMSKPETKSEPQPVQTHLFHAGADSWTSDASPVVNSFRNSLTSSLKANVAPFSPSAAVFSPNAPSFSPNAPAFSTNQSSFSFSASGPKFRPDAPAFTPFGGMSDSFTNATGSGNESGGTRPDSIFGKINLADISTTKKSKAVPIIRPSSAVKEEESKADAEDADGRAVNEARPKRAKAYRDDGDSVPLFAEPTPSPRLKPVHLDDDIADTTLSSTVASEQPTDSRAVTATSPSDASVDHLKNSWTPYEFDSQMDVQSFNSARPFGEDTFKRGHKKSLSATANAFTPGHVWSASGTDQELDVEEEEEDEDEREREATIEPPTYQTMAPATPPPQEAQPVSPLSPEVAEEQQTPFGMPALRKGLGASRFASPPKSKGLKASRFASPVRPEPEQVHDEPVAEEPYEPTFEEIDAIMDHLNQNDPTLGVNKAAEEEAAQWHQPSPTRQISIAAVTNSSPYHAQPTTQFRSESPRRYHGLPNLAPALPTTELEDPFVDPPKSAQSYDAPIHHLNENHLVANSDWDGTFSDEEQEKLGQRVQFFDGRVSDVVGELLNARLQPLEKTLLAIERHFAGSSRRTPSSVPRERRSTSAEIAQSDADDEDDDEEPVLRRSMSPRRDRKMDQIRAAVLEAFSAQQRTQTIAAAVSEPKPADDAVLHALEDMKAQLAQRPEFKGEELRDIVEQAVEKRMAAAAPKVAVDEETAVQHNSELQAKIADLEQRLYAENDQTEKAIRERRDAEELASELNRKLSAAETRVEVEIMNRSVYDQRIGDLEDRLKQQESRTDEEVNGRRAAEDRLSEVQRLLRISSEEENRLREVLDEREHKLRAIEQSTAKSSMRMSLLEAAQTNSSQSQSEMTNRVNVIDADLRESRKEAQHYKSEFERVADMSRRYQAELNHALEENKQQQRFMDTLGTQLHEIERIRESWRAKFISLQEDMAQAARDITEENARRTKREQALVARQEVLDAKLQAEARTRERIETELERLENGERQGLRAISEMKRLEGLLTEMRTENHKLQQTAMRYQREFEEARESGASEVQRTRRSLQAEVDAANHQVNVVRRETDDHINKLTADLDQAMLDVESAKAKADMLVEEAQTTKETELAQLKETHANQIEDLQTRHAMQLGNTIEEAQKSEQLLLERLSLSSSKTEHLQDRVAHLEEKLEIAKEAALAAAKRAKSPAVQPARPAPSPAPVAVAAPVLSAKASDLPERISPQALRESIMVLQEQLQAREQQIEDLEQKIEKLDPEAPTKISKRDDEITWLRELLAVRHGDLQDIIRALSGEQYDREAVKDAAIRLKANLQMEEQERERAMNGGSAINLPSIAQTLQNASPRVAQAVGPLKAAWGSWVKSQQQPRSMSSSASSPAYARGRHTSTPSRSTSAQTPNSVLSGLMTPPASGLRQTPTPASAQPTAFANTGRRLTSAELAKRAGRDVPSSSRQGQQVSMHETATPPRRLSQGEEPVTPPMIMHSSAYDSDAHAADFDDNDFFEED